METNYDVMVIGAGVAGITAALYLKRANIKSCIMEKSTPGGLLNNISTIENYPGYKKIKGSDLAYKFYEQLIDNDIEYIQDEVLEIIDKKDYKIIKCLDKEYTTKKIIIAIGRKPKNLEDVGAEKFLSKGISFCAICDGALYKDKNVLVVGGGNSAIEEALYLSDICKNVYMLNRTDKLRGDKGLVENTLNKKNIKMFYQAKVLKFLGKSHLEAVDIDIAGKKKNLKINGCFIYIGFVPATDFLKKLDILDNLGYIIVDETGKTKVDGIYACGDVIKKDLYQLITGASEGATAAVSIIKEM